MSQLTNDSEKKERENNKARGAKCKQLVESE